MTSLLLVFIISPYVIAKLKRLRIGQHIRDDGPLSHLVKAGTPTMGGVIIFFSLVISTLLWARLDNRFIVILLLTTVWLGTLGFLDDYIKLLRKNPRGLSVSYKLLFQIILALIIGGYLYLYPAHPSYATSINIPYFKDMFIDIGWLYIVLMMLIIVGASNAVNLTDGLDGLAIGTIICSAVTYSIFAYLVGHSKFASYLKLIPVAGGGELTVFLMAMIGAGLGFLWFNSYPAEVFMGDTGSLFLGGTIGVVAIIVKHELLLILVGGIFVFESLSVIIQVTSFKWRGKRIFKMAPLHHHFELKGWAEPKVVIRFWIISMILSLIALSSLKIR